jgi:hypothetical protein
MWTGDPVSILSCPGISGQYVTVRLEGSCLQLRELEVLALREGDGWIRGHYVSGCVSCLPGQADADSDPATPCVDCEAGRFSNTSGVTECSGTCSNGTYAAPGSLTDSDCISCLAGQVDADSDPGTPCDDCEAGRSSSASQAGECSRCPNGTYSPAGSTSGCVGCLPGQVDADSDPATPCADCEAGRFSGPSQVGECGGCTQWCEQGTMDSDCDETTPCDDCTVGLFSTGGYYDDETRCMRCQPGLYAPPGSSPTECQACPMGRADDDGNQWTPCQVCAPGSYSANSTNDVVLAGATRCLLCAPGTTDHDANSSTACELCGVGLSNLNASSIGANACVECEPGRWSYDEGLIVCPVCPVGEYRGVEDEGCKRCDASLGHRCEAGSTVPQAAGGYYAELVENETGGVHTVISQCNPFPYACLGTCPPPVQASILARDSSTNASYLSLAECTGGVGAQSCTNGYGTCHVGTAVLS